ncbi:DNA polymerase III subunit gamma/tau [Patescibacteria group bacterium]|nr:DNA polymerase III subunit gamma/tau [Patescibacteria group bacterium]MBU0777160.1 DNA polymerase III subunit gamma/tau [Patescibacteria group bacterium]MBU0845854.1 DNA polymerase III subunit gamma/tau [Patescibacteria group bacterium]MBU0922881.1 DNA polymerase III subunit gamma/tau [Patescibacteria group bacterium]MBU1066386.1 DNA polymerase III subunit gamma/tau [Patescibacteria group bacterium]
MTYYLKYRPQKIEDLDIHNVRESLGKIVASGKIPHAFLFSGPKGTGKTSAARILAKVVNCQANEKKFGEPCNKCSQCKSITRGSNIDVIELDAASHRGIDDVRALRDAVKLAPASSRKKVYIIDEAHMLTTEAANALLKTLEEPPDHVMFILATTNPEKLIETIRSRVTNIVFKKATEKEVERSLAKIARGEKLKDKGALSLIAKKSDGSFRDGAKILEELVTQKIKLNTKDAEEFLFKKKTFNIEELLSHLSEKNTKKALKEIEGAVNAGVSLEIYTSAILRRLRDALLNKVGLEGEEYAELNKKEIIALIRLFVSAAIELRGAVIEQLPLEVAVIEWCDEQSVQPEDEGEKKVSKGGDNGNGENVDTGDSKETTPVKKVVFHSKKKVKEVTEEVWTKILLAIKPINTSIEALLRAAKPLGFDGKVLTLSVFYRFHKERLEDTHHLRVLEGVVAEVLGCPTRIQCLLAEPQAKQVLKVEPKEEVVLTDETDEDIIKVAKEIFGN